MANGKSFTTLAHAVRSRVVLKYLAQISLVLAALTLVPFGFSLWVQEYHLSWAYAFVIMVLIGLGLPWARLPETDSIQLNEGLVITAIAFLFTPVVMSYPMIQEGLSPEDAFFESVSAITTTGLSTLPSVTTLPKTILFARAWMQWYGGLGIVVLSVALLLGHGLIARRLAESEIFIEKVVASTRTHARRIFSVYSLLTVIGIVMLWGMGVDGFVAITHVLSAVSTGGFSTFDHNLAGFNGWMPRFVLMVMAFSGALALPLYSHAKWPRWRELLGDLEVQGILIGSLFTSGFLAVMLFLTHSLPLLDVMRHAFLIGFSAQTGTGFTTLPIGELEPAARAAMLGSMVIGGSLGSTAGGIKVWRFLIILGLIRFFLHRTCLPQHAVLEMRLRDRRVGDRELQRTCLLVALFCMVIFLSWLPFIALGFDPLNALFEVVSATGTVGLSAGITQPSLHPLLKLLLCGDMLLGRLEIVTFLVLLYPPTWFGKRAESL